MKLLILNGPNLNLLSTRDKTQYGEKTLEEINEGLREIAARHNVALEFYQSNHEGDLIDKIQELREKISGILVNPGALTHYGYSLRDALEDTALPVVEVHLSNIEEREEFRKIDVLTGVAKERIVGLKEKSYAVGLGKLLEILRQ
ncbi:MAG: type II 3-dehydroquinate dehydratase [Nanoarchaeota archaeon]|nr:type II 3-dehydroquinate dehydratase [Nanoarchaeota archaeon]